MLLRELIRTALRVKFFLEAFLLIFFLDLAGESELYIAQNFFQTWVRNDRALKRYRVMVSPRRFWEMEIITLVGETGTGKSRWAFERYPELYNVPQTKQSGCYWDCYDGQETVFIDEMYGHRFSHGFLLQLLDRYAFMVPTHGGQVPFSSRRIIFASNAHPAEWYDEVKFPFVGGPLERRLTQGTSRILRVDAGGVIVHLAGWIEEDFIGPMLPPGFVPEGDE